MVLDKHVYWVRMFIYVHVCVCIYNNNHMRTYMYEREVERLYSPVGGQICILGACVHIYVYIYIYIYMCICTCVR